MPLKLVRRPKSPYWVLRGSFRGIRIEESTGFSERGPAEEYRIKREKELQDQAIYGNRAVVTFAQAAISYLQNGGRNKTGGSKRFLEPVISYFGETLLANIDLDAIEKGAAKTYPKASPATRNRQFFTPTAAVLRHAAKRGWCSMPILERPRQPPGIIRWLTPAEADRLIQACSSHLRPLVIFLLYTGARAGEALWLDWSNVDLSRAHVTFPRTKNGDARGVPLHPRVVAALANLKHRDGFVFRRPNGLPYSLPSKASDTSAGTRINTAFKGACRRAGIENFRVHDCRHTWATWHYAANRDLGALQKLGGWKSEKMVMRYAHVNVEELAHTINSLPGGFLGEAEIKEAK